MKGASSGISDVRSIRVSLSGRGEAAHSCLRISVGWPFPSLQPATGRSRTSLPSTAGGTSDSCHGYESAIERLPARTSMVRHWTGKKKPSAALPELVGREDKVRLERAPDG